MSIITNGKQGVTISSKDTTKNNVPWAEPPALEQLNWLIYLTHSCGEINLCKDLINDEISRSFGRNEFAYYQKGIILKEENKMQDALEAFQICHKLNSKNVENIKQVASCLFLLRKHKLALEAYLEAEKSSDKPDWEICHKIGECLYTVGELSNAKDYARRAVQLGKQEASYALLIKVLVADDDLRSAVAVSNAALDSSPDSINMLSESGLLYLRTGHIQQALERLSSVLALDPVSIKALLGLGAIIQSHEEYDVALSKYKLAVTLKPESLPLWNNIGMCFYGKQKYVAAVSCLKRALWYSPLNWRVLYNLGLVHLGTQQAASAFNFLCAAVNLRPDHPYAFMLLGCALLDLGDLENASRALRQAAIHAPNDQLILGNAGLSLMRSGDESAASAAIVAARAFPPPQDPELRELIEILSTMLPSTSDTEDKTESDDHQISPKPENDKEMDVDEV